MIHVYCYYKCIIRPLKVALTGKQCPYYIDIIKHRPERERMPDQFSN